MRVSRCFDVPATYALTLHGRSVEAYDEDQFATVATGMIRHVARMLGVPLEQAGSLLGAYSWDAQALIDAFISDPDAVAARCGVSLSNTGALSLQRFVEGLERHSAAMTTVGARAPPLQRLLQLIGVRPASAAATAPDAHIDDEVEMCGACLDDVPRWRLVSLGCGHVMCDGCWRRHLASALEEHGKRVHIKVRGSG